MAANGGAIQPVASFIRPSSPGTIWLSPGCLGSVFLLPAEVVSPGEPH